MDEYIDNLLFQFDDMLFDDPTFNEFNCPLPQDGPDLIRGSPDALDEAINKLLGLEGSPSGSCLSLTNLAVTDIGFMQIQRFPAPRGRPHQYQLVMTCSASQTTLRKSDYVSFGVKAPLEFAHCTNF